MTKKYTSKDFNKQDEFHDDQDDSFYDVSFDLPIDEDTDRHSSPKNESALEDSTNKDSPSKWDGFYDDFKEKQEASFEQAKQEQVEIDEKLRLTPESDQSPRESLLPVDDNRESDDFIQQDAAKSSVMLDRSIRKVRSLFADFDNYEPPVANPYKSEVNEILKQRGATFKKEDTTHAQATVPSLDEGVASDSQETTPKWFKRFRQSTTDHGETFDGIKSQHDIEEGRPADEPQATDSLISQADSDNSRSVTGVSLFKKLFKANTGEDSPFEKDTTTTADGLDRFNTDPDFETIQHEPNEKESSLFNPTVNETAEIDEPVDVPLSPTASASDETDQPTSWYQRFSPFKETSSENDLTDQSLLDSHGLSLESPSSKLENYTTEGIRDFSKEDATSNKESFIKKRVENELTLDKDYFDSQKPVIEKDQESYSPLSHSEKAPIQEYVSNTISSDSPAHQFKEAQTRRRLSSDLPSPEEIRKERERRRRLRVQELEQMTSSEEVEKTYKQSYTEWLKDYNKKTIEKDTSTPGKDKSVDSSSTLVASNLGREDTVQAADAVLDEASQHPDAFNADNSIKSLESTSSESEETINLDKNFNHFESSDEIVQEISEHEFEEALLETPVESESFYEVEDITDNQMLDEFELEVDSNTSLEKQSTPNTPSIKTKDLETEEATVIPKVYLEDEVIDVTLTEQSLTEDEWSNTILAPIAAEVDDNIEVNSFIDDDALVFNEEHQNFTNETDGSVDELAEGLETDDHNKQSKLVTGSLLVSDKIANSSKGSTLDLTEVSVEAAESEDTHFTVIHEPVNSTKIDKELAAEVEANLLSESIPIYKRKDKKIKKEIYSLASLSTKERIFFGINIAFNVIKRIGLYIILIGILGGAMAGGVGFGYFANLVSKTPPPSSEEMATAINRLEQQSTLYYANGEPIANIRADVVRTITNIDEISPYIIDGLIATEDEDFYNHPGVMPKAIFRAVIESILTDDGSGGSTLTQQLVKQQLLSPDVTFFRKANEILLALRLENYFTKDQILMAYLNVSPFGRNNNGDNVAGIMKAAEGIFGVKPTDVTLNQAAFLVGLPQDPYNYTPYDQLGALVDDFESGINRMQEVLYRMYREEKISKEEYDSAIAYDITQDFLPQETRDEQRQSYLYQAMMNGAIEQLMLLNIREDGYDWKTIYEDVDWYNEYYFAAEEQLRTGGYKVYTTIDKEIYDHLQVSAAAYDDQLGATYDGIFIDPETGAETYYIESVQTGIVVIDNKTGKVLGFVSGTDFENNQIDHAFNMRRSPGSTIKPLAVYGPAIEENLINPSTIIPDTEFVQTLSDGSEYRPTNYGEVISGTYYSARTALMKSDNIPTIRIYDQLINRKVPIINYLEKMGFNTVDSYTETETQYLSFALGGVGTGPTVFEQTRAFSTFANNGQYVDGYFIERIEDTFGNVVFQQNEQPVQVFSEDSNYLMVDMLRDTMDGGSGQTAGGVKNFGGDWISKSGISENSKDIWFIGSTPAITIGSWIGYDNQYAEYVFDLNDGFDREAVRSQTYWGNVVNELYALRPDIFGIEQSFTQPDSVQSQAVLETTGTLSGSVQINNRTYQVTSPTYEDLFKKSNPAPALSFNFMFNAADTDHQTFWAQYAQVADQQRQQQQQQSSSSSSSSEAEENSGDETSETPPEDSPPEESSPEETPPAE